MARILVIDDDESTRAALRAILEPHGYDIVEAADGEEGVKLYRQDQADLIILDILMPEKEGLEVIRELKRDYPNVLIIAISGSGIEYLDIAREFGALYVFKKPFDRGEIVGAIKELLGSQKSEGIRNFGGIQKEGLRHIRDDPPGV